MLESVKAALEQRGFTAHVFPTSQQAKEYILSAIAPEQSVGFGGSMTLQEMGLDTALAQRGNPVYWHWTAEDKEGAQRSAAFADVYLTSVNAVTEAGQLISIDGHGNRLAAMLHGPGKVLFVVGKNKLARDYDAAMARIKSVACVKNAQRMNLNTPCVKLGHCTDCASPQRICGATLILEHRMMGYHMEVLLVDEELGY